MKEKSSDLEILFSFPLKIPSSAEVLPELQHTVHGKSADEKNVGGDLGMGGGRVV